MKMERVNKKHKYSTWLLMIVGAFSLLFWVMAWDTGTIDLLCNDEAALLKRIDGVWGCSVTHFAEGHYQDYSIPLTITISAANTYYNVTGYESFFLKGIYGDGDAVIINKTGIYRLIATMSFNGGNAGDYETALFVNGAERHKCSFQRTTSSNAIGDATLSCILSLNKSNQLVMKIKDISPPAQNINIYSLNFNIMEVS